MRPLTATHDPSSEQGYRWKKLNTAWPAASTLTASEAAKDADSRAATLQTQYELGFREGVASERAEVGDKTGRTLTLLDHLVEELQDTRRNVYAGFTADILAVVDTLFKTLFDYELRHSAAFIAAIESEIERQIATEEFVIGVHPQDYAALQELGAAGDDSSERGVNLRRFVVDEEVGRHQFLVSNATTRIQLDPLSATCHTLAGMADLIDPAAARTGQASTDRDE